MGMAPGRIIGSTMRRILEQQEKHKRQEGKDVQPAQETQVKEVKTNFNANGSNFRFLG